MRKLILIYILYFLYSITGVVNANVDYETFQEITINGEGKLLRNFTDEEYDRYYKEVEKRSFFGWRIYKVHDEIPISYVSDTLFSYYNDGDSAIEYEYDYSYTETTKTSVSASGGIKTEGSGSSKKFKSGLTNKLDISYENSETEQTKIEETIKMQIDPGCKAIIYVSGEGYISNGVGAYYIFFVRTKIGGWEYFTSTTQYRRMEKIRI